MEKALGVVKEVFLPKDNINSKEIGFKVKIDNKIIKILKEQDNDNANILRDDIVVITKQIIDDLEYIDIELYDGDDYE